MRNIVAAALALALSAAIAMPLAGSPARGDEYTDALDALCERVKSCAIEAMGEQGQKLSGDMKAMIDAQLAVMCDGMKQQYSIGLKMHELYQPALACMQTVSQLSCKAIQNGEAEATPTCAELREKAAKYE